MMSVGLSQKIADGVLQVGFAEGKVKQQFTLHCVIDLTGEGIVVGVEVLDFRRQTGGAEVPVGPAGDSGHVAYDAEMDALYVRIGGERGPHQRRATGVALIGPRGQVLGIEVAL